jgi:hypothetical protein
MPIGIGPPSPKGLDHGNGLGDRIGVADVDPSVNVESDDVHDAPFPLPCIP